MSRPVKPRSASEHLVTLSRVSRAIEIDAKLSERRKKRLLQLLAQLMGELQKDMT